MYADGYDAWKRNLYVNSSEATIIIKLKDEEGSESSGTSTGKNSESSSSSTTENSQSSQRSQSTENKTSEGKNSESQKSNDDSDVLKDLLSSLYNTSTNVSK